MQTQQLSQPSTLHLQRQVRSSSKAAIRLRTARRLDAQAERQAVRHEMAKPVQKMSFGHWRQKFGAMQVETVPHGTPKNCIWTWVDGPRFHGDVDIIVPGHLPELAIKVFVTEVPFETVRMEIMAY